MTEDELELLHRYLDGAITQEELESLEELLRNNAEARATLRSLATIDAKWQQLAAEEVLGRTGEPTSNATLADADRTCDCAGCWCIRLVPCPGRFADAI